MRRVRKVRKVRRVRKVPCVRVQVQVRVRVRVPVRVRKLPVSVPMLVPGAVAMRATPRCLPDPTIGAGASW